MKTLGPFSALLFSQKPSFVKLYGRYAEVSGSALRHRFVNVNKITHFGESASKGPGGEVQTIISFGTDEDTLIVNETPEEILKLIKEAK